MRRSAGSRALATVISVLLLFGAWYVFSFLQQRPASTKSVSHGRAANAPSPSDTTSYPVAKVVDGDTIDVDMAGAIRRIRLLGINTPETVDPRKPVQCFGKEASDEAKRVLTGKKVHLEADPSQDDTDIYGRLLRYVFLEDGTNFDFMMISEGYAFEYTYHLPYKYQAAFKSAQTEARLAGRGLWAADTCNGELTAVNGSSAH